jgi:hypothetical protein
VSRILSLEIARYVFSPDTEFLRRARDDEAIRTATGILAGARTQREVLAHAEARTRGTHAATTADSTAR